MLNKTTSADTGKARGKRREGAEGKEEPKGAGSKDPWV